MFQNRTQSNREHSFDRSSEDTTHFFNRLVKAVVENMMFRKLVLSTLCVGVCTTSLITLLILKTTSFASTVHDPIIYVSAIGAIGCVIGLWTCINGFKLAEKQLDENLDPNRRLLSADSSDRDVALQTSIILTTDVSGNILNVNEAFCTISGYSRDELIGNNCRIINSGYHNKEFFTAMFRTICNGDIWKGEICNRNKDGSIYWVDTTIVPLRDKAGKIVQFYSVRVDITKQKEVENDLKMILDAIPSIIICKDEKNIIHHINRAGADALLRDPSQVEQRNAQEFYESSSPFASYDMDLDILANGQQVSQIVESQHPVLNGNRTLKIDKIPILDSSGFFSKLVTIATDITDVAEIEQRLSFAIESTSAGIWDWDLENNSLHTNELYFSMLGDDPIPSPITAGYYYDRMHKDDLHRVRNHVDAFVKSGEQRFHDEFRLLHKDGSYRWIETNALVIESNTDGSAKRIIGQHHDIDDTKRLGIAIRAALELKPCESQHETLHELCKSLAESMNAMFAGVATFDDSKTESDVEHAHLVAGSMHGLPVDVTMYELKGTPCENTLSNRYCYIQREVTLEFPDDTMLIDMNAQGYAGMRLTDSNGTPIGIIMVVDDKPLHSPIEPQTVLKLFGARASVELEHRRSADHLKEALKLAETSSRAKSDFIANMSHEIRTPMTAILGNTDILGERQEEQDQICSNAISTIRRNGEHLLTIINDILDISKIEAGKMKPNLSETSTLELLNGIEQLLANRAREKGLRFHFQFPTQIPAYISTDPVRLRQILLNLVGNAIKFTDSGTITLLSSFSEIDNQMIFEVRDTGIGMTPAQCTVIFDAFTQADSSTTREYGGSGLGLKISSTLVNMLGGKLEVESKIGVGSRFWFTINIGDCDRADLVGHEEFCDSSMPVRLDDHTEPDPTTLSLHGSRILLVEDGPDNQALLRHHLTRAGAEIDIADNGKICLDKLAKSDHYDLVLMDMQMPVLDGYETTRQIREQELDIPIIALTAHAMSGDRKRCIAAGCDDYHPKPINKLKLLELCSRIIEQSRDEKRAA